jgi:hypothetical protein
MADYKGNADLSAQKWMRGLGGAGLHRLIRTTTLRRKRPCGVPFQRALCLAVAWPIAHISHRINSRSLCKQRQRRLFNAFTPHLPGERASDAPFAG